MVDSEGQARRKEYRLTSQRYQQGRVNVLTLKAERNSYYYIIRRAKRHCWATFLQRSNEILWDRQRCWTALRYTSPRASYTKPARRDLKGNTAISLEERTEMVGQAAVPPPPADLIGPPLNWEGTAHQRVGEASVRMVLFDQSQKKPLGRDRPNFSTLRLQWE